MRCGRVRRRLSAFQDGELKPLERDLVRAHLAGCPACRGRYEALELVWRSLKEPPGIEPSPGFRARLLRRLDEPGRAGLLQWLGWPPRPLPAPLSALALLVVGLGVGTYLGNLLATGDYVPWRSRSADLAQASVTLAALRAFDPIPPGTLAEGYQRLASYAREGDQ